MFERFSDRSRQVVVLAQEEARMLDHNYIGTEHLLLGLIHEGEDGAAQALESFGVSLEDARQQVKEIVGEGQGISAKTLPFSSHAKKALELGWRESMQWGLTSIDTEHLLLGLIREGEGGGAQVLQKYGVDLSRARAVVIQGFAPEASTAAEDSDESSAEADGPKLGESAARILDRAKKEAAANGDHEVDWRHILVATLTLHPNLSKALLD